jgi:hypothetical protein
MKIILWDRPFHESVLSTACIYVILCSIFMPLHFMAESRQHPDLLFVMCTRTNPRKFTIFPYFFLSTVVYRNSHWNIGTFKKNSVFLCKDKESRRHTVKIFAESIVDCKYACEFETRLQRQSCARPMPKRFKQKYINRSHCHVPLRWHSKKPMI